MQKDAVMSLSIYADAVFYSRHNVTRTEASRDALLTAALRSRKGSLQLYNMTIRLTWELSVGLDLLPLVSSGEMKPGSSLPHDDEVPDRISFKLFTDLQNPGAPIRTIVVENLIEASHSASADEVVVPIDAKDLPILVGDTELSILPDRIQPSTAPSHLRILSRSIGHLDLSSPPTPLMNAFPHPRHHRCSPSATEINLAYTLAHSALFLLGTPWFTILDNEYLLRYKLPNQQEHTHLIWVPYLEPNWLYSEDPDALLESSQLFRIGLLLLHIALPTTPLPLPTLLANSDEKLIWLLPHVSKAMGDKYCRAMAFCLVYRRPREDFRFPSKYSKRYGNWGAWMGYLTEFLGTFYEEVFLPYVFSARVRIEADGTDEM